jgi:hypothetical protein
VDKGIFRLANFQGFVAFLEDSRPPLTRLILSKRKNSAYNVLHRHNILEGVPGMAYLEGYLQRQSTQDADEHTGYVLQVEVEMSAVQNVEELVNEQVAITGEVEIIDYPDRGKELVFRATLAAAIEEEAE